VVLRGKDNDECEHGSLQNRDLLQQPKARCCLRFPLFFKV